MATQLQAITFDFWNTLMVEGHGTEGPGGRRLAAWAGILEDTGFAIERERLEAAFSSSWKRFLDAWGSNRQYVATHAAEDILAELGYDVPAEVRDRLHAAFTDASGDAPLALTDGVADALRAIKEAGLRIGIVCDVGMTPSTTLRSHLERQGVLDLFDHWSFSDEVGHYKPSPIIFEHALAGLGGPDPSRVAHIGDLRRTDVAGAKAMGMVAIRYTGAFDDQTVAEPEGDHVVAHHSELPAALGIA